MITCYNSSFSKLALRENLHRIGNQIFKLLPMREEKKEWEKLLETLIIEIVGMSSLFSDQKTLLTLASKLEGIKQRPEIDFFSYRRTIFECCSLIEELKQQCL